MLAWKDGQRAEISNFDYKMRLKLMGDEWDNWEDTEKYITAFSKVVALNSKSLWNIQAPAEDDEVDESKNVNQQYAKQITSLNETLQKEQTTLVDELTKQVERIDSIKKNININQRFRFVNDLFEGDGEHFNKIIEQIDHCTNYHEAVNALDGCSQNYKWDQQNQAVIELFDLVSKRFIEQGPAFDERPTSAK